MVLGSALTVESAWRQSSIPHGRRSRRRSRYHANTVSNLPGRAASGLHDQFDLGGQLSGPRSPVERCRVTFAVRYRTKIENFNPERLFSREAWGFRMRAGYGRGRRRLARVGWRRWKVEESLTLRNVGRVVFEHILSTGVCETDVASKVRLVLLDVLSRWVAS